MTASKLAPRNIMVNVICPGVFPSRMTKFGLDRYMDTLVAGQPTGRIGKPSDFGGLVLFLGSMGSAHMVSLFLVYVVPGKWWHLLTIVA
jgi:NAD(P)-dependent dehydrogenase (short-subunit alcohol dehydrogenase family)